MHYIFLYGTTFLQSNLKQIINNESRRENRGREKKSFIGKVEESKKILEKQQDKPE